MNVIVGGTGALGGAIARRLLDAGEPVRVVTRRPERAANLAARGAEVVWGDLLDRDSLTEACREADAVVAAAHSIFGRGRSASVHVDGRGHRDLVHAALSAEARHFVYTSVYDYGPAHNAVPFFQIKREMEGYVKSSGIPYTVLRPTAFMESHAHALIGEPILRGGRVVLLGRGDRARNFVAADDVADIAVRALHDPALAGQTVDVGGPEDLTNMDVVRLYERVSGRPARVTHLPLGPLRVASRVMRPVHPGLSQVLLAGVLADTADERFDARPLQDRFGIPLTRLEDWVTKAVSCTVGNA